MRVGGIVLCGGRSSRMGRPKAWLPFGGELMLQRVVRVLRQVVDPVVVVAAPGQDVPPLPSDVGIVRDEVEGKGPLGGLVAGLAALEEKADAAYLSSCDVPFLKAEFVERVISFLASGGVEQEAGDRKQETEKAETSVSSLSPASCLLPPEVAVPRVGGYLHPLAAVYRLAVLPHVRELLAADRLRPVF